MHTIEKTKNCPCGRPFDALLADIFNTPEKQPERRKEPRDKPADNNHKITLKTLALLVLMVVVVSGVTAYIVGAVYCKHALKQSLQLSDGTR